MRQEMLAHTEQQGALNIQKEMAAVLSPEIIAQIEQGREVVSPLQGINAIKEAIIREVLQERARGIRTRRVVAILGLTGTGKTTIAGQLNHELHTRPEIIDLRNQHQEFNTTYVNTGEIVRMLETAGVLDHEKFGQYTPDDMRTIERQALHVIQQFLQSESQNDVLILELGLIPNILGEGVIRLLQELHAQGSNNYVDLIVGDPSVQESAHEGYRAGLYDGTVQTLADLSRHQHNNRMNIHGYEYSDLHKAQTDQAPPAIKRAANTHLAELLWSWSQSLQGTQRKLFEDMVSEYVMSQDQLLDPEEPGASLRMAYEQAYWAIQYSDAIEQQILYLDPNKKLEWYAKAEELGVVETDYKERKGKNKGKIHHVDLAINLFKGELEEVTKRLQWREQPHYLISRQELQNTYQAFSPDLGE